MTTSASTTEALVTPSHKERTVVPCNFRSAGRLSNDSTRHLRMTHETFARNISHSLDLFLGSPIEVKMVGVEQLGSRELIGSLQGGSYLVPFSMAPMQGRILARFGSSLLFPLLDLLLGGNGDPDDPARELTDLDEELIRSVTELIGAQLERAWKSCQVAITAVPSIKPALVGQIFAAEELVAVIHFEMTIATTTGVFDLVLPMAFSNALIRASQTEATRRGPRQATSGPRLRDRLLDCTMLLSTELSELSISVGDLVALQPGDVVNLHSSINTPVKLKIGAHSLFEVTPVRHSNRKTAQLERPCQKQLGGIA